MIPVSPKGLGVSLRTNQLGISMKSGVKDKNGTVSESGDSVRALMFSVVPTMFTATLISAALRNSSPMGGMPSRISTSADQGAESAMKAQVTT